jgi:hypothetical protein
MHKKFSGLSFRIISSINFNHLRFNSPKLCFEIIEIFILIPPGLCPEVVYSFKYALETVEMDRFKALAISFMHK